MDARLQRRLQRYGWDRAAVDYEALWQPQLAAAQTLLLQRIGLRAGERVLDVACGTGLVALSAAQTVGHAGRVLGVDLSAHMVALATERATAAGLANLGFMRMDGESLAQPNASVDVLLCALGLMYMPSPEQALREMHRVLRPGGRLGLVVWGERALCGWSALFGIVDAEVASEVCPLFFRLGQQDSLARLCTAAGFERIEQQRLRIDLDHADAEMACRAAFAGGPVALAWARFDAAARSRVRERYLEAIAAWRSGDGYRVPGELVMVWATQRPH